MYKEDDRIDVYNEYEGINVDGVCEIYENWILKN